MSRKDTVGAHKTTVHVGPGKDMFVRYHNTQVVHVTPQGKITLNTGGYRTNTTKARMNQASKQYNLGFEVYQKDHEWFVDFGGSIRRFEGDAIVIEGIPN